MWCAPGVSLGGENDENSDNQLKIAASHPDDSTILLANVASGSSAVWIGELPLHGSTSSQALAVDQDKFNAITAATGPPISAIIALLSRVHWMLGYPDQAPHEETCLREMLSRPVNLFIRVDILWAMVWTRCFFLRDYGIRSQAKELLSISARERLYPSGGPWIDPVRPHFGG
jgi:hypothetical protein